MKIYESNEYDVIELSYDDLDSLDVFVIFRTSTDNYYNSPFELYVAGEKLLSGISPRTWGLSDEDAYWNVLEFGLELDIQFQPTCRYKIVKKGQYDYEAIQKVIKLGTSVKDK